MPDAAFVGTLRWIPATENGPSVPFDRPKMTAFAYVEPQRDEEGAILIRGLAQWGADCRVEVCWLPGYPIPDTNVGDVISVLASQRRIATITVTGIAERDPGL